MDDLTAFMEELRSTELFEPGIPIVIARAPGRLDVMGGIADYSGSLVLQQTIAEATFAALQRTGPLSIEVVSLNSDGSGASRAFTMPLASLFNEDGAIGYDAASAMFLNPGARWAAYVIGVFLVLIRERGVSFPDGARILVSSSVPEGKGVASSAALEVAVMAAVASSFEIKLSPKEIALLCQAVENRVAGAPCGVMDQMTASCGDSDSLLALVCQPAELLPPVRIPQDVGFWGLDSGERHAVSGSDYVSVRTAAFMGYRMMDPDAACLALVTPEEFETEYRAQLPEHMTGAEFLARYSGIRDTATAVDPERAYPVRQASAHPVYENNRVQEFRRLLLASESEERRVSIGDLMYRSHESYSKCGLGSPGTDLLVRLVRDAGPRSGLYGARITGGGSGGAVVIAGRADAGAAIAEIREAYRSRTGCLPYVFSGSSPGACLFGTRTILL